MKTHINLDGWVVAVDWEALYYGQSFFVPSMNWKHDKRALLKSAEAAACGIRAKGVIENNIRGIRVWVHRAVL